VDVYNMPLKALLAKFDNFSGAAPSLSVVPNLLVQKLPTVSQSDAITVHKSEGLTLECAIVGLLTRELGPSQTHVARAKPLRGLIFEKQFATFYLADLSDEASRHGKTDVTATVAIQMTRTNEEQEKRNISRIGAMS
jgi:hypothetical protein